MGLAYKFLPILLEIEPVGLLDYGFARLLFVHH
jgi:hypothetical protein